MTDRPQQRPASNPASQNPTRPPAERPGPEPRGRELAAMPRGPREEFRIALDEYEGKPYLSLRVWERSPTGQWWPVKGKGVTVRIKELDEAIGALQQAASILGENQGQGEPSPRANRR